MISEPLLLVDVTLRYSGIPGTGLVMFIFEFIILLPDRDMDMAGVTTTSASAKMELFFVYVARTLTLAPLDLLIPDIFPFWSMDTNSSPSITLQYICSFASIGEIVPPIALVSPS